MVGSSRPQCRWRGDAHLAPQAQSQEDLPRRKLVRRNLRAEFGDTDKVGVQDFVLLDDFKSESAFIKNLRDRFASDLIYVCRLPCSPLISSFNQTYIGNVVVSVNPYKELSFYSPDHVRIYYNVDLYELPPHVYVWYHRCSRRLILKVCTGRSSLPIYARRAFGPVHSHLR